MAVRQYVGARYVPKFYEFNNGVWESNTEYEPLTIVQYNSNSYTSKKTVPANIGNPSDNPDYWVVTGNYNAQVENYRQQTLTYRQEVIDMEDRVNRELETQSENVTTQLAAQNENVATQLANQNENVATQLANQNDNVERELSEVNPRNKKWFLFGDSIAAIETGFTNILKQRMGDRFNFKATGSLKYSTNSVDTYYIFTDILDQWLPTISNKDSYTDVLIELGSNDTVSYSSSHLTSGFNSAINKIKTNFPNAIIHIAIVGKSMNDSLYSTRKSVINQLKQLAGSNGCTWVTNNDNILGAKYQTFDRIHPTENGHNIIANSLMSYMMGGDCTPCTLPINAQTGNLQGLEIKEEYDNGKYHFSIHGTINNSNGIHIPSSLGITGINIGTVNLNYCYRDIVVSGFIQAELTVFGTTVRHSIPCTVSVVPRNDNSTTCDVLLAASYIDYYRNGNGETVVWSDGFTFTQGILICNDTTVPA